MKVLVCDSISKEGLAPLLKDKRFEVIIKGKLDTEELSGYLSGGIEAVLLRSGTKIKRENLEKARKLRIIARAGVGIDNIDLAAATEKGVLVINAPSGNTIAACEHTVALILSLARKIPEADRSLKSGRWDKKAFIGVELFGRTAGIIGIGKIGMEVARRLASFEMKILGFDPYVKQDDVKESGIEMVDLPFLLKNSDIITVHVPKNENTVNLINYKTMSRMKKTAFLVNCSRGGIVNENDLVKILSEKKIAAAALDVFEIEPLEKEVLRTAGNLIITPHLGASTIEAQEKVALSVAEDVKKFFDGEIPSSACNFSFSGNFPKKEFAECLALAECLGSFAAQASNSLKNLKFTYGGEIAKWDINPIKSAFLAGLLSRILDERVNLINAVAIARKRKILWNDFENPAQKDYSRFLEISAEGINAKGIVSLGKPRLVECNGFATDIVLEGNILMFSNRDVPGIIGKVGTIFGKEGLNIASMDVVRKEKDKNAFTMIKLDEKPGDKILNSIEKIGGITNIKRIVLS